MIRWTALVIIVSVALAVSCAHFFTVESKAQLGEFEKKTFVIKNDIKVDQDVFIKGQKIKVKVFTGSDWVKIRGYNADKDPLRAKQVLLIFMFEDEFPGKKFNMDYFTQRLSDIAVPADQK